jgi:hypothetical protein
MFTCSQAVKLAFSSCALRVAPQHRRAIDTAGTFNLATCLKDHHPGIRSAIAVDHSVVPFAAAFSGSARMRDLAKGIRAMRVLGASGIPRGSRSYLGLRGNVIRSSRAAPPGSVRADLVREECELATEDFIFGLDS